MKTLKITLLIIWSCVTVALIAFFVILLNRDSIFGINYSFFGGGLENLSGEMEVRNSWEIDCEDIDSIKIDWVVGNVDIQPYDGEKILITESARRALSENEVAIVKNNSSELEIIYRKNTIHVFIFNIFENINIIEKELSIKIPDELYAEWFIDAVSSNVTMNEIISSEIKVDVVSGTVLLNGCEAENAELSTVSGKIIAKGTIENLTADTVSGAIEGDFENYPKKIKIDSVSGGVTLYLLPDSVFSLDYEKISGKLTNDFPTDENSSSKCSINVGTVSGSLKILAKSNHELED